MQLGNGMPVPVGDVKRFSLTVSEYYSIARVVPDARGWDVLRTGYAFALDDREDREIFAYHWHPDVPLSAFLHLHINRGVIDSEVTSQAGLSPALTRLRPDVADAHFPTHHITLGEVARLLITQFGVRPRRADWDTVLRAAEADAMR